MATKLQMYSELAQRQAEQVTRGRRNWTRFLDTAARLYKYPFHEQLMIYAQRPDATACAPIKTWNDPLRMWVRRGSKGIALIDDTGMRPRLKYVFDISDTEPARGGQGRPYIWEMKKEHEAPALEALARSYDGIEGDIPQAAIAAARQLANEYWNDNARDIAHAAEGSFLGDYDGFSIGAAFRDALEQSVAYCVMSRCGVDPFEHFEDEDFQGIFDFNTPTAVYALGTAVSDLSEQLLRDIEIAVKKHERRHAAGLSADRQERGNAHGRINLQPARGLPAARPGAGGAADGGHGGPRQVRDDAQRLPHAAPSNIIRFPSARREAVPPPDGDGADGVEPDSGGHGGAPADVPAPGQGEGPLGMGGPHGQPSAGSRGGGAEGSGLQLNHAAPEAAKVKTEAMEASPKSETEAAVSEEAPPARPDNMLNAKHAARNENLPLLPKGRQLSLFQGFQQDNPATGVHQNLRPSHSANLSPSPTNKQPPDTLEPPPNLPVPPPGQPPEPQPGPPPKPPPSTQADAPANLRPILPSEAEQRERIEKPINKISDKENAEANEASAFSMPYAQGELDALLIQVVQSHASHGSLEAALTRGIRSQEASLALKEAFNGAVATAQREDGYIGLVAEGNTFTLVVGQAMDSATGNSPAFVTETLHWPKISERLLELAEGGLLFDKPTSGLQPEPAEQKASDEQAASAATAEAAASSMPVSVATPAPSIPSQVAAPTPSMPASAAKPEAETATPAKSQSTGSAPTPAPTSTPAPEPAPGSAWRWGYKAGDTARLEDGKPFLIESVGRFDVHLQDTSLLYPIGRSESIERFEALIGQNPLNDKLKVADGAKQSHSADSAPRAIPADAEMRMVASARNYRITDDSLGEGGAKAKFNANLAAIRTLFAIEAENRNATPEEQETLARYVGWGGLPQAFDPANEQWAKERAALAELLAPQDYESARASTLNAHYTPPAIIKAIYDTVERLGFKSGNVLEPSCGIGNFFGLLPDSMANAKLYGVELDGVTGRIARKLYPKASIDICGFEKTATPDAFFDIAVGNVPFGNYGVADKRYGKLRFNIHDYFFAKALDQVRPGGIIAFITTKGTMDKRSPAARKYIAQRAELLGAVRLPNDAFRKNAGTGVTSDIVFLQKRDRMADIVPEWAHLGETKNGVPVNSYFADNPEMVLGEMSYENRMYGNEKDTACLPAPGADLSEQLRLALAGIGGQITVDGLEDVEGADGRSIPADPGVRNFSYANVGGAVYYRENSSMYLVDLPAATLERIKGMAALRDCAHALIDMQLDDADDGQVMAKQAELGTLYDSFTGAHGLINSPANNRAFVADSAYYLLCSLEILDENGRLERKADMFDKRTVKRKTAVTSVDTPSEALAVSIAEKARVDLPFMASLAGLPEERIVADLEGAIFRDLGADCAGDVTDANGIGGVTDANGAPPASVDLNKLPFVAADEYLSGNVREKIARARLLAEKQPELAAAIAPNIAALAAAQPKDLEASEISVRLGSTWVPPHAVRQFMHEAFQTPYRIKGMTDVKYSPLTGEWHVANKNHIPFNNVLAYVTYGTDRMNAYQILEEALNLRDVRVYDIIREEGKDRRALNKKETAVAQQKQESIKQAFKDWVWKDPARRRELTRIYNERFNSARPREYDGRHISFSGISPDISLRKHQLDAIAHILYGGNTLLAHEVGAGKTFEMAAAAMESKRLGLCQKSLFAVPNHLTEQWAAEFLRLYPSANILVATKKDFEMGRRKKFCAKIATGDYDAVILGHSQLEKIPMSRDRQERMLREQIRDISGGLEDLRRARGERFTVKQYEKTKKSLEARLAKLLDGKRKDDVVSFEQLGADRLFVDEAHYYKNLFLFTKMRNVAGLSQSEAQKSSDLFMKCRYLDELTGGKGVVFATGTPISNSMAEMYTMQRYLQFDTLQKNGLAHFDAWASTFGETVTAIELAPEGTGYRARTRFARFHNLPELMAMFKEVADIKTSDQLGLPRPQARFDTVAVKPTELQEGMVKALSERAAAVHSRKVDPSEDNMLKITGDGRKIGLDQRLVDPALPDDPGSKVNACVSNVFDAWRGTAEKKLTQLIFCDFSTPGGDGRFNVYDDIKAKLVGRGVPEREIAFIHDASTEARKKELFAKVRQGKVRVLIGSTFKMGSGTNVQDRLIMLHDLDCPWRPSDLEQRAGRIVRQGNQNPEVFIRRYVTESTFDAYLYQTIECKQRFVSQIMSSKSPARSCEDVDEAALSYAEIKALCAGDPLIKEKMDLDIEVSRLRLLKAEHLSQRHRLEDSLATSYPLSIGAAAKSADGYGRDIETLEATAPAKSGGFTQMEILGATHGDKDGAGKALLESLKSITGKEPARIGSYRGFQMHASFNCSSKRYELALKGGMSYQVELGGDAHGNITRINNALAGARERLGEARAQLENLYAQVEGAKLELSKPFPQDAELESKAARLALVDAELNIDGRGGDGPGPTDGGAKTAIGEREPAKGGKASIIGRLGEWECKPPGAVGIGKSDGLSI